VPRRAGPRRSICLTEDCRRIEFAADVASGDLIEQEQTALYGQVELRRCAPV
jgi:hypothetical protein